MYQKQEGKLRVIAYGSRTLTAPEKNYYLHSGKLEFLALKWSVCDKFNEYLYYSKPFVVFSDNNPLSYVLSSAKLNAKGMRWLSNLSQFQFVIRYRPGKDSKDCDFLSRIDDFSDHKEELGEKTVGAILQAFAHGENPVVVNALNVFVKQTSEAEKLKDGEIDLQHLQEQQQRDEVVGPVYEAVTNKRKPMGSAYRSLSRRSKQLMRYFEDLFLSKDNILMKKISERNQIVLPGNLHHLVYVHLHERLGHVGSDRVIELAKRRFYWPGMSTDISCYVKNKCKCLKDKKPNLQDKAELGTIESSIPFEVISIDFLHLDKCKGGFEYLLVCVDNFTRFAQAYPTKKKSGKAAAEKIFNDLVLNFGFPVRIHHDRGKEFNILWQHLHDLSGIKKSNTTPYHPMGNGQCERFNRTVLNMLKTLTEKEKSDWKAHIKPLTFAYNSTVCRSTGYSPHYLMFGRESRLPIDFMFPENVKVGETSHSDFVKKWKQSLQQACDIAQKSAKQNKSRYDKSIRGAELVVNDRVLVRNLSERGGTGKLRSHWEEQVYRVTKCHNDIPVYDVVSENGRKKRTLHRNLLLKCNLLPLEQPVTVQKKAKVSSRLTSEKPASDVSSDESSSDEDFTWLVKRYLKAKIQNKKKSEGKQSKRRSKGKVNKKKVDVVDENGRLDDSIVDDGDNGVDSGVDRNIGENSGDNKVVIDSND